jgi:hypothetical protein
MQDMLGALPSWLSGIGGATEDLNWLNKLLAQVGGGLLRAARNNCTQCSSAVLVGYDSVGLRHCRGYDIHTTQPLRHQMHTGSIIV